MLTSAEPVELAQALRLAVGRFARRLRQGTLGQLTPSQHSVLASLSRHGTTSLGLLAEIEGVAPASISGVVARLVDKGMVNRSPNPEDGRSFLVGLTELGRDGLEKGREERTAIVADRLQRLSPGERQTLAAAVVILDRLGEEE